MFITKELVILRLTSIKVVNGICVPSGHHIANQRSIDFATAVKFGSDSDAHATKPSDLTSTAVRSLSSLAGWRHTFNRSFQV
jgi:hypothetical protein